MQSTRETIYSALFAYFSAIPGLVTVSRRAQPFEKLTPEQTPALFQTQVGETQVKNTRLPGEWHYRVELYVYVATGGIYDTTVPSTLLNPILDSIENSLEPSQFADWTQTLGNLAGIHTTRILEIETSEGVLGTTAVARIPIEVVVLD